MSIPFKETLSGKPFLKWAGGKSQLIRQIAMAFPGDIKKKKDLTYIEPFIGSGAILFWALRNFPNIKKAVINDINTDLTNAYIMVKERPDALIKSLKTIENNFHAFVHESDKKKFFMEKRQEFNDRNPNLLKNAALLIFLNHTCFNGLYRVNRDNQFNVPFGRYTKPKICDSQTILADSRMLKKAVILNGDYQETLAYSTKNTFFYFDPPYKPISKTAVFNSYSKNNFDDNEQTRLRNFCYKLTSVKHAWLLSNSDPKNIDPENKFFEILYSGQSVFTDRVIAKRVINSDPAKRGEIFELLISNYPKG